MAIAMASPTPSWSRTFKPVAHHRGFRTYFSVESFREMDLTKSGQRRVFKTLDGAQKRCDELNAAEVAKLKESSHD